jgi:hypothetical protein
MIINLQENIFERYGMTKTETEYMEDALDPIWAR